MSHSRQDCVFGQFTPDMKRDNQSRTIITGKYQLIRYFDAGRSVIYPTDTNPEEFAVHTGRERTSGVRTFFELYDIENDPFELNNLGTEKEYEHIVKELSIKLFEWM